MAVEVDNRTAERPDEAALAALIDEVLDDQGASDVVLQAQIWFGGKTIAASRPRPVALQKRDGTPVPETNEMPLDGLAPGLYELRVVVVDRKANATVFRKVDFTVE